MSSVVLSANGLAKRIGSVAVADGVDISLRRGEIHALIGPNGAGKTSLVRLLCGEWFPDAGHVVLEGIDITSLSVERRALKGIGRSFQVTSVLKEFTALENVMLAVKAHQTNRFNGWTPFHKDAAATHQAMQALERVGLGRVSGRTAAEFGYGELRQLEIAMVLARKPVALLLDEPLAGMGVAESRQIIDLIGGLKGDYSILLIEHDMNAVFSLADRVTVLVYGRVIASGTPAEIQRNPEVRASYLGAEA